MGTRQTTIFVSTTMTTIGKRRIGRVLRQLRSTTDRRRCNSSCLSSSSSSSSWLGNNNHNSINNYDNSLMTCRNITQLYKFDSSRRRTLPFHPTQQHHQQQRQPFSSAVAAPSYNYDDDYDDDNYEDNFDKNDNYHNRNAGDKHGITRRRIIPIRKPPSPIQENDANYNPSAHHYSDNNRGSTNDMSAGNDHATTTVKDDDNETDSTATILPPPLPQPKYSVFKRVLPSHLIPFSSLEGRQLLLESIAQGYAEPYWRLTEQFINQSDPAFCGITTLLMCLNASSMDPNVRWMGGWRFYASEDVLLHGCCLSKERIQREGIVMDVFSQLAKCHGLHVEQKHATTTDCDGTNTEEDERTTNNTMNQITLPATDAVEPNNQRQQEQEPQNSSYTVDEFRSDIRSSLSETECNPLVVVSFSRQALGQTGDGHFSPIAAYNETTDQVLILDVARFKYAPYWSSVTDIYKSMQEVDDVSGRSRGWFILQPPKSHPLTIQVEDRRPAELVPVAGKDVDICPVGKVKVEFCQSNPKWNNNT